MDLMHDSRSDPHGHSMMQLAETGFAEWNEAGEDIYDAVRLRRRA